MGRISSANFAVFINGASSSFFSSSSGLKQGCPLLSLPFLSVIEGLSRMINLTHLLFVDCILIPGERSEAEWRSFHIIFSIYYSTSVMKINEHKSTFYINNFSDQTIGFIVSTFPYKMLPVEHGFHYLGFFSSRIARWLRPGNG